MIDLNHTTAEITANLKISGSKSESNRWLILQQLFTGIQQIHNISTSEDTKVLQKALKAFNLKKENQQKDIEIDIGHAGTAMRFLTAYFAMQPEVQLILTGSERMQQRPIAPLVEALNQLGCEISYLKNLGFPPLKIKGKQVSQNEVEIQANISSQYITALLMMGASLPQGLIITFRGNLTSRPYLEMTKNQLEALGIEVAWLENGIQVYPKLHISLHDVTVESDWSSASYWFSMIALSQKGQIRLQYFKKKSWQGDIALREIYKNYFGVNSTIEDEVLIITKIKDFKFSENIALNLNETPDIAQTIAVTCAGLKIKAKLTGLSTLKVKETDRLAAIKNELLKVGVLSEINNDSLHIFDFKEIRVIPNINTYQDHRMAMAFAPLALNFPLIIQDENVVDKSYPNFWNDLVKAGFKINHL